MAGHRSAGGYSAIVIMEYYEYLMPGTYSCPMEAAQQMPALDDYLPDYDDIMMPWLVPIANLVSPVDEVNYLADLESHMPEGNYLSRELAYGLMEQPEQAHASEAFELPLGEEPEEAYAMPATETTADRAEDDAGNGAQDKRRRGNRYRAEQGYLVEEPSDSSDEEQEQTPD